MEDADDLPLNEGAELGQTRDDLFDAKTLLEGVQPF
jgi:hypothetical protein